jgi:hypothetical protein
MMFPAALKTRRSSCYNAPGAVDGFPPLPAHSPARFASWLPFGAGICAGRAIGDVPRGLASLPVEGTAQRWWIAPACVHRIVIGSAGLGCGRTAKLARRRERAAAENARRARVLAAVGHAETMRGGDQGEQAKRRRERRFAFRRGAFRAKHPRCRIAKRGMGIGPRWSLQTSEC